jgi:hypothetical protein
LVGDTFDYGKFRQLSAGECLDFLYSDVQGLTSSLLYFFVVAKFCLPRLKYLLGGTQRILVQIFDVHSFSEISDTHKHAQSLVRKADCMGNVTAFPTLEFLQFGKKRRRYSAGPLRRFLVSRCVCGPDPLSNAWHAPGRNGRGATLANARCRCSSARMYASSQLRQRPLSQHHSLPSL